MKILLVSPLGDERSRLASLLQQKSGDNQFDLFEADNGKIGLQLFADCHPDLVIISTSVSGLSGAGLCREIRKREGKRHTGIIFLANELKDNNQLSVECLEVGADDFLRSDCLADELIARVIAVLRLKTMTDELRSANHRLHMLSLTDDLTGLSNMRSFNQRFAELLRECREGLHGLGVIMLDLDHFKNVNDSANHLVGSHVIREVGRILGRREITGRNDLAARYGGDEFILCLSVTKISEAEHIAESIRQFVRNAVFKKDDVEVRVTASVGVAFAQACYDGSGELLVKAADMMLYKSKEAGRDYVSSVTIEAQAELDDQLTTLPRDPGERHTRFEFVEKVSRQKKAS